MGGCVAYLSKATAVEKIKNYGTIKNLKIDGSCSISLKGVNSVALGNNVNAEGDNTFAEGNNTVNKGNSSHTEGLFSKVDTQDSELTDRFHRQNGYAAHAEGYTSLAVGCGAHSEGMLTKAIGSGAHSEGYRTIAKAGSSHAEGSYSETTGSYAHAEGKYNVSNEGKTIHSVGIGSSSKRKNAHEIMLDGKHYIYGVGGYDGTNPDSSDDLATILAKNDDTEIKKQLTELSEEVGKKVDTDKVATINGQSLVNGGDITIKGGSGSYDDTELRDELARLKNDKAENSELNY